MHVSTGTAAATDARLQAQVEQLRQIEVALRSELQVAVTALTAAQASQQQQQQQQQLQPWQQV
jgi:hypothetical protein